MELILDASLPDIRVALSRGGELLWGHVEREGRAEVIESVLRRGLTATGSDFSDLEQLLVFRGPGSFTGLRVALAFAQGLAFVPVRGKGTPFALRQATTFELLAAEAQRRGALGEGTVLFPARKGKNFAAQVVLAAGELPRIVESSVVDDVDLEQSFANRSGWSITSEDERYRSFAPTYTFLRDELLLDAVLPLFSRFPLADPVRGISPHYIEKPQAKPIVPMKGAE